jgi:hypothetical protein
MYYEIHRTVLLKFVEALQKFTLPAHDVMLYVFSKAVP